MHVTLFDLILYFAHYIFLVLALKIYCSFNLGIFDELSSKVLKIKIWVKNLIGTLSFISVFLGNVVIHLQNFNKNLYNHQQSVKFEIQNLRKITHFLYQNFCSHHQLEFEIHANDHHAFSA